MIFAAIDISSNSVDLKIASYENGVFKSIVELSTAIDIGEEAYDNAYISVGSINLLVSTLLKYKKVFKEYGVERHKVIATGAIGSAKNSEQVKEIIRSRTGLYVDVIESAVENYHTYRALIEKQPNFMELRKSATIVDVHSGSTDVTIYHNNAFVSTDSFKVGTKIAAPLLEKLIGISLEYPSVLHDYLGALMRRSLKKVRDKASRNILIMGTYTREFSEIMFDGRREIEPAEFYEVFEKVLSRDFNLAQKAGDKWKDMVFLTLVSGIYVTEAEPDKIFLPDVSLIDGILVSAMEEVFPRDEKYQVIEEDILEAAAEIAKRFKAKRAHIRNVEFNSLKLFDALRDKMGLDDHHRFLLRLAVHLVEIGKALKRSGFQRASYDMLKHIDLFGVEKDDMKTIANTAVELENIFSGEKPVILTNIMARKLAVLVAVGLALDITNYQRIKIESVEVGKDSVILDLTGLDIAATGVKLKDVAISFLDCTGYELLLREDV